MTSGAKEVTNSLRRSESIASLQLDRLEERLAAMARATDDRWSKQGFAVETESRFWLWPRSSCRMNTRCGLLPNA